MRFIPGIIAFGSRIFCRFVYEGVEVTVSIQVSEGYSSAVIRSAVGSIILIKSDTNRVAARVARVGVNAVDSIRIMICTRDKGVKVAVAIQVLPGLLPGYFCRLKPMGSHPRAPPRSPCWCRCWLGWLVFATKASRSPSPSRSPEGYFNAVSVGWSNGAHIPAQPLIHPVGCRCGWVGYNSRRRRRDRRLRPGLRGLLPG